MTTGRSRTRLAIAGGVLLFFLLIAGSELWGRRSVNANAHSDFATGSFVYLPIIQKPEEPEIARVVVTERGYSIGYPSYDWVYGYVENLSPTQNFSITVGVDVTYYPYCDPTDPEPDCEPYTVLEVAATAFEVTLPGQINPFQHSVMSAKTSASLGQVYLFSVVPASQATRPVQIMNWARNEGVVSGIARNDTIYKLNDLRVVLGTDSCSWREAALDSRVLLPGQETYFSRKFEYCEDEALYIVGQGIASPASQR